MKDFIKSKTSQRSFENLKAIFFDYKRYKNRLFQKKRKRSPVYTNLQLGAGVRKVDGWLNVDLVDSDVNLDLTYAKLPWYNLSFNNIVSQHLIEHLFIKDELIPLFKETHRILKKGGVIWLATPDLEKICKSYINNKCYDLKEDREKRLTSWSLGEYPSQHMINDFFYQEGGHKNLFDFELLQWVLNKSGFNKVIRITEKVLLEQFPEFPKRNDDIQSLYVMAKK